MSLFRNNIRKAIADEALQAALDKNAEQRLVARDSAYLGSSERFEFAEAARPYDAAGNHLGSGNAG